MKKFIEFVVFSLLIILLVLLTIYWYFKYKYLSQTDEFLGLRSKQCEKWQIISNFDESIDWKKSNIECTLPYRCRDWKVPIIRCSSAILENWWSWCRLSCFQEDF